MNMIWEDMKQLPGAVASCINQISMKHMSTKNHVFPSCAVNAILNYAVMNPKLAMPLLQFVVAFRAILSEDVHIYLEDTEKWENISFSSGGILALFLLLVTILWYSFFCSYYMFCHMCKGRKRNMRLIVHVSLDTPRWAVTIIYMAWCFLLWVIQNEQL